MSGKKPASGIKGNPAAHRMTNKALAARRAASWMRGQKRKANRREQQAARARENRARRAVGELTPWQQAKAARRERRQHEQLAALPPGT